MKQQKTHRHHFVPECYLKKFILNKELCVLDIRKVQRGYKPVIQKRKPAAICYLEDYYKIEFDDNDNQFKFNDYNDNLFIETSLLTILERKYDRLFKKLTEKKELDFKEAIYLSDFIIQMKLRNPFWLEETIIKNKDSWIDSALKSIYEESFTEPIFSKVSEELKKIVFENVSKINKRDTDFSKKFQLFGLIQRFGNPDENKVFREAIINCEWQLFKAPSGGPFFITSDNPGFRLLMKTM